LNIKISIPVTVGGYTGQRDQWEEGERDYYVRLIDGKVVLEEANGAFHRKITFSNNELLGALGALNRIDTQ
jgi:hypothetical protein